MLVYAGMGDQWTDAKGVLRVQFQGEALVQGSRGRMRGGQWRWRLVGLLQMMHTETETHTHTHTQNEEGEGVWEGGGAFT